MAQHGTVKPIPERYRRVTPALVVNDGGRAISFYAEVFGATERSRFAGPGGKIAHAELVIGDSVIILEDASPAMGTQGPPAGGFPGTPVHLYIYVEDVDGAVVRAVELGATLKRPARDQFYGDRDAFIVDPFGHGWTVSTHIEEVAPEEMVRRMAALQRPG